MAQTQADLHAANELVLYIENDGQLYQSMLRPIVENMLKKVAKRKYKHSLAIKGFEHLTKAGAIKYCREFGSGPYHQVFNAATRREAARDMVISFENENGIKVPR